MEQAIAIRILTERDVALARDEARAIAEWMHFDRHGVAEVALAVSEMAQNVIRYANHGEVRIEAGPKQRTLRVLVSDTGPGIGDLGRAMREGHSTDPTSLGLGFTVARRSMDWLDVATKPGEGTQILMEKYLPLPDTRFEYGAVSVPDDRYLENGDEFLVKQFDGETVLVGVIDGIGQGVEAHRMAVLAKSVVLDHFKSPLDGIVLAVDQAVRESGIEGGLAMSLALIAEDTISYLGIGDTHSYVLEQDLYLLRNFDGRVGAYQLPRISVQKIAIKRPAVFITCTDGINTKIHTAELSGAERAQNMANNIFNTFHRSYGDVTVMVAKMK